MAQNLKIKFYKIIAKEIRLHSSPYHPQTNGVCEVVHKEIRKYIYTEYFKNKENFDLEDELFNITKIHDT